MSAAPATRQPRAAKPCGVPGCADKVAPGTKLRLTSLEVPTTYPLAQDGQLSTCKPHRECVGFNGLSPDIPRDAVIASSCSTVAKVFYLGRSFCEKCHNVYLEALVAQCKPHLTGVVIEEVRRQVVKDNYVAPAVVEPQTQAITDATAALEALKVAAGVPTKVKKTGSKKAAAAPAADGASTTVVTAAAAPKAKKASSKKAAAAAAPPPPPPPPTPVAEFSGEEDVADDDGASSSRAETEVTDVEPAKAAVAAPARDPMEVADAAEEVKLPESVPPLTKDERAAAAVVAAAPKKASSKKTKA